MRITPNGSSATCFIKMLTTRCKCIQALILWRFTVHVYFLFYRKLPQRYKIAHRKTNMDTMASILIISFALQVVGTGMLVMCILAIIDGGNIGAPKGVEPLAIGLIIMAISVSMGLNCGYPLNPARDLGPRLFTAVAGWGMEVFRYLLALFHPTQGRKYNIYSIISTCYITLFLFI